MKKKIALSIIETALILAVVASVSVIVVQKMGDSIKTLGTKTTSVTINNDK